MWMKNEKISLRQYKRLLFFDMVGLGLVLLPDLIARNAANAGGMVIFLGALLASLYASALLQRMQGGVRPNSFWYLPYGIYLLMVGAYGLFLLTDLVHTFLLPEESVWILSVMILLLLLYSRRAGLEGRGRTFEVLFVPMLVLLLILLLLGASSLRGMNLFPLQLRKYGFSFMGWYPAFLVFSACQFAFFMGKGLEEGVDRESLWKGTCEIIFLSAFILFLTYEMLLGSFGSQALGAAKIPIMIFTSNIVIPGGFLRRQEALVAGICFVGLIAFCGSGLHYGIYCLKQGVTKEMQNVMQEHKCVDVFASLGMLFLGLAQYYYGSRTKGLGGWLLWISPVALCLPFLLMETKQKKEKNKWKVAAMCFFFCILGCGCSAQELENKSFPMVMTLGAEDGECVLTYKYMDLSRVSEKEKTKQGSDELTVHASSVVGAIRKMDEKNGKIMDLNHVKVLLLEESFLEDEMLMMQLVEKGNGGVELPGNMLVFVTKNVDAISRLQGMMDEDLGNYLAELLEENPNYNDTSDATFKSMICDWYNGGGNTILPSLGVQDDLPVVDGYYLMQTDASGKNQVLAKVNVEEGHVAGMCSGAVGRIDMDVDGGQIHLENVKASYEYTALRDGVECYVTIRGDIMQKESAPMEAEKLKEEAAAYFSGMIQNAYEKRGMDLTNSYGHLRCHDLDLYEKYEDQVMNYRKDLCLHTAYRFRVVE